MYYIAWASFGIFSYNSLRDSAGSLPALAFFLSACCRDARRASGGSPPTAHVVSPSHPEPKLHC